MQISREALVEFFDNTREFTREHEAKFDIDQACRWSFYFADTDERKLTEVGSYLESEGYEPIGFIEADEEDDNPELIYLRVDKIETYTVDSLDALNQAFYALAEKFDICQYEGMDVSEVDSIM